MLIDFDTVDCNPGEVNLVLVHSHTSWSKTPRVVFTSGEFQISGESFDQTTTVTMSLREMFGGKDNTYLELVIKSRGCGQEGYHQIEMSANDYRFLVNKMTRLMNEIESGDMDH